MAIRRTKAVGIAFVVSTILSFAAPVTTFAYMDGSECTTTIGPSGTGIIIKFFDTQEGHGLCVRGGSATSWGANLQNVNVFFCDGANTTWSNCISIAAFDMPCTKSVTLYDNTNYTGFLWRNGWLSGAAAMPAGADNRASSVWVAYDRDAC